MEEVVQVMSLFLQDSIQQRREEIVAQIQEWIVQVCKVNVFLSGSKISQRGL